MAIRFEELDPATRASIRRQTGEPRKKSAAVPLIEPGHSLLGISECWTIPLQLVSVANGGSFKRGMIGHAAKHRRAVSRAFAPHLPTLGYFVGKAVECRIVRISPGELDTDNLALSAKWVRDTVGLFLGCDDGPRGPIQWSYGQERGPAYGVRIELRAR